MKKFDVLIVGAGAAGLMCAIEAGKRGRRVLVLEHNEKIGEKIRISGGGRCNFTNLNADHGNYLSGNPHFCKSALARFTTSDFIALVEKHGIAYHEKKLGQLFCNNGSQEIIAMLSKECGWAGVEIMPGCRVSDLHCTDRFICTTVLGTFESESLVVATGGLSIPQLGATDFAYKIARQFGLNVTRLNPGLVPLMFREEDVRTFRTLSGVSVDAEVSCNGHAFREKMLFTHRGLSGPAILQISSYWKPGDPISINLLPDLDVLKLFQEHGQSKKEPGTILDHYLPRRFVKQWIEQFGFSKPLNQFSKRELETAATQLHRWEVIPLGTEGFGKAEVTTGGVDTDELSSKTMEAKKVSNLYFIGECVDVTGWLGGYNFQWAWSSSWVAGQYV